MTNSDFLNLVDNDTCQMFTTPILNNEPIWSMLNIKGDIYVYALSNTHDSIHTMEVEMLSELLHSGGLDKMYSVIYLVGKEINLKEEENQRATENLQSILDEIDSDASHHEEILTRLDELTEYLTTGLDEGPEAIKQKIGYIKTLVSLERSRNIRLNDDQPVSEKSETLKGIVRGMPGIFTTQLEPQTDAYQRVVSDYDTHINDNFQNEDIALFVQLVDKNPFTLTNLQRCMGMDTKISFDAMYIVDLTKYVSDPTLIAEYMEAIETEMEDEIRASVNTIIPNPTSTDTTKTVWDLDYHESLVVEGKWKDYLVTRVPGGWLYKPSGKGMSAVPSTFVPWEQQIHDTGCTLCGHKK